ncbi:tRNA (adenosine(37)-N6)-threonylcarbamoyltransferase complex dimerization subunit type 1 TsaB [Staphylococcus agnetis]|uniref:tRNA (adenosine(37)-N6)-threonylcarbamoyltransferase complex dimerization subunit type 1 TsaB n=1 Tax=Staphylococcus agnetis TaxID=985762 RepID=UPI000CD2676B|nr:tRNA (adenosine(37)-N6)-threonylcarbamoyltransferase complex dimerization subunit type 1 TsaB [Staphylococcus agnetis]NJH67176.1 tRNA (adenosine(37)-N6)-threonylcarbamoyltransferase complex dimerization subunit type 1 TsaB [Staphylococcus agnetis]NJH80116.1 tRNA (adenosine(37)-N6)-threonylcarbamoyltransferase complex dimerization subunit type 1 TsaB [Staphylococcus agnetis]PNY85523.1 tRNA (adenosine(37)-N6)-threonylcarbamoyltransferase complex dimerization subunit type 1 TsaB [Staphylococcus 
MISLLLDSSNQPLSVAVMKNDDVLASKTTAEKRNHSIQLMPTIKELLDKVKLEPKDLNAIIVAQGPGSYTGLRIGVTTAKTLAYTLNIPLYGVSSLSALAATVDDKSATIVPIFNARRGFVFAGVYQWHNDSLTCVIDDQYIELASLITKVASMDNVVFVGEDTEQFEGELEQFSTVSNLPQAHQMYFLKGQPVDVHTFVPSYLKLSEAEQNWMNQQSNSN